MHSDENIYSKQRCPRKEYVLFYLIAALQKFHFACRKNHKGLLQ